MLRPDPAGSLKYYPMPMQRFGLNPFGENLYRIVLGSSRRSLIHGQWNQSGAQRSRWCQTYPQFGPEEWILEKWIDAFSFTGCTPSMWTGESLILGPYPHRGEYVICGNTSFDPAQTNVDKLINLINAGDRHSWAEKLTACRENAAQAEKEKKSLREAIILDALPAFGHAPFAAYGGGGGQKKSTVTRDIREVNRMRRSQRLRALPVPKGQPGQATTGGVRVKQQKVKFDIPVSA